MAMLVISGIIGMLILSLFVEMLTSSPKSDRPRKRDTAA
jgi:hypothetical protein